MGQTFTERIAGAGNPVVPWALAFAALWAALLFHLGQYWHANAQYSFGWLVPPLAAVLFYRRWQSRPEPHTPHGRSHEVIFWTAAALLLPLWFILQPNPDWRVLSWLLALEVVVMSLCGVYWMGGKAWVKHFAFPVCFILAAVPWLAAAELLVIQKLMLFVASVTVELLEIFNVPALQEGNLIQTRAGLLGVEEACSGVRSLQAALMMALFLGELYLMPLARRLILLAAAVLLAISFNVVRTAFLALVATQDGPDAVGRWHDSAGYGILTACILGLWLIAALMGNGKVRQGTRASIAPLPARPMVALCCWLALVWIAAELWYTAPPETPGWAVRWPESKRSFEAVKISAAAVEALRYDKGTAAQWQNGDGSRWTAFFFEWEAGPSRSRILARIHRPEICLPGTGMRLEQDLGVVHLPVGDFQMPFRAYTFDDRGRPLHVFYSLWQDGAEPRQDVYEGWGRLAMLKAVWLRERNLSQQVLEIVVAGYPTAEQAIRSVSRELPHLIERG